MDGSDGDGSAEPESSSWFSKTHTYPYPVHFLRDSVSLTSEPRKTHPTFHQGLRYYQSYTVCKELFDAAGTYPFTHTDILHLGYSAEDWAHMASAAKITKDRAPTLKALASSIGRVQDVLEAQQNQDRGWRCEFRITRRLARVVQQAELSWEALLEEMMSISNTTSPRVGSRGGASTTQPPASHGRGGGTEARTATAEVSILEEAVTIPRLDASNKAFYVLRSASFVKFLYGNIHKHLLLMDSITSYYGGDNRAPQAAASLYGVVAFALQHFISHTHAPTAWMLYNDPPPAVPVSDAGKTGQHFGLGITHSIEEHGFGFLPGYLFDWQRLAIQSDYLRWVSIPEFKISRRHQAFRAQQGTSHFIDEVLALVERVQSDRSPPQCSQFLCEVLVDLILQEYRQVAATKMFLHQTNHAAVRRSIQSDSISFSLQGLTLVDKQIGGRGMSISTGNKRKFSSGLHLFRWTWTNTVLKEPRKHIENLSFRVYYHRVMEYLQGMGATDLCRRLSVILFYRFFQQHSALPYPDGNGTLTSTTKHTRERLLFCYDHTPMALVTNIPKTASCNDELIVVFGQGQKDAKQTTQPYDRPMILRKIKDLKDIERSLGMLGWTS